LPVGACGFYSTGAVQTGTQQDPWKFVLSTQKVCSQAESQFSISMLKLLICNVYFLVVVIFIFF